MPYASTPAEETPGNADAGATGDQGEGPFVGRHGLAPVPVHRQGRLDPDPRGDRAHMHHWERDLAGRWFGLVDYAVPLVDDFRAAQAGGVRVGAGGGAAPARPARRPRPTALTRNDRVFAVPVVARPDLSPLPPGPGDRAVTFTPSIGGERRRPAGRVVVRLITGENTWIA